MQGAVAGSPGTLPTNWVRIVLAGGLSEEVVGTGISDGITYIDVRFSGTTTNANGVSLSPDGNTSISASSGQSWTWSSYITIVGGSLSNISAAQLRNIERTAAGSFVGSSDVSFATATGALRLNRFSVSRTLGATAGYIQGNFFLNIASGVAIDITLRIGLPQLEQGAFATSVIPTTTTAVTRNADVASMTGVNFSSWYNQSEGTLYMEASTGPIAGRFWAQISDNSTSNRIQFNTNPGMLVITTGTTQAALGSDLNVRNTFYKSAGTYKVNDIAFSRNGSAAVTDTSATIPVVSQVNIGSTFGPNEFLNSTIKKIAYYPFRLTDSQLQALTS